MLSFELSVTYGLSYPTGLSYLLVYRCLLWMLNKFRLDINTEILCPAKMFIILDRHSRRILGDNFGSCSPAGLSL